MNIEIGDKLILECLGADRRTTEKSEEVILKTIEHHNKDLYIVTFENKQGNYAFTINELLHFKETNKNICEYCIIDNMDRIDTCTLTHDKCISKEYMPSKNNCERYKNYK